MQYQVLIQNQNQNGYMATVVGFPDCTVEGSTKEEALARAKAALLKRLAESEIFTIELEAESTEHPLLKHFGRFKDDPTFDDYLANIEAYRKQLDAEECECFYFTALPSPAML